MLNKWNNMSLLTVVFTFIFVRYYKRNKQNLIPVQRTNYILQTLRQTLLALVLIVFCVVGANAQAVAGWEKYYGVAEGFSRGHDGIQTVDEGFIIVGERGIGNSYIVKTNPDGRILWNNTYDLVSDLLAHSFKAVTPVSDGYVAVGYSEATGGGSNDVFIVKINEGGEVVWSKTYGSGEDEEALDVIATADNGIAVIGSAELANGTSDIYLLKLDAAGDTLWTNTYGGVFDDEGQAIIEIANGDLVITGKTEINTNTSQALFLQVSPTGDEILFDQIPNGTIGYDIIAALEGGYTIAGALGTGVNEDAVIIHLNDAANVDWSNTYGGDFSDKFNALVQTTDGDYAFAGTLEMSALDVQGYAVKTDVNGFVDNDDEWENNYGSSLSFKVEEFESIVNTFDGGFAFIGSTQDAANFNPIYQNIYTTKVNSLGQFYSDYINGTVYQDINGDNVFNAGDQPIEGWIVEAISEEHTCYGTSLADGSYSVLVDTGMYDIVVRRPNDYWNSPSTIGFNIPNPDDTFNINFAVQDLVICSDLEVDISTAALVPGESAVYKMILCNNGTATANDPYIDVTFDEAFTINGVSENFSFTGDVLRIEPANLDLAPFDCKEINIDVTLSTDLLEGETHSMKAHAFPDEICTGGGDGSHLEVRAECVGDEVNLVITNTGTLAMSTATDFIIIEDMAMLTLPESVGPLEANEEITIPRAANGSTYRIIANQTPGHPGDSRPTTAIEGCVAGGGSYTTGFVNQFTEDDYDHFLSVDCQENVNTLLPNESRGYPKGYNSATDSELKNEISPCIDLKYIHRFQNTGPDTAIRVVIQDTLSRFLDPASVRPGASSHDYRMEVYGCGILRFTFENIYLAGSSTDPQASQVFVKYRVSQRPSNPAGAIVDNSAAAYFDYKAPVKTDSIYNTIAEDCAYESYVDLDTTTHVIYLEDIAEVNIFPNPFQEEMTVEIIGEVELKEVAFVVYDLTGRLVRRESFSGQTFQFSRNNLTTGMYLYSIESEGQTVSTGKIVIQ